MFTIYSYKWSDYDMETHYLSVESERVNCPVQVGKVERQDNGKWAVLQYDQEECTYMRRYSNVETLKEAKGLLADLADEATEGVELILNGN